MLRFFFSSKGRQSRRQLWLGSCLMSLAMIPSFVAVILAPHIKWWAATIMVIASFLIAGASAAAMSAKRAHDLGKPNIWALWPLMPIKLLFSEGQAHHNQYGRVPNEFGQDLHIGRWVIRLGLISIAVFGIVSYRSFAGPSWKLPDCKAAVVAEGVSVDSAEERWRQSVASAYGTAYADSEPHLMQSTVCNDGICKFSARPCVQLQ